jgi:hypothetical protein
MLITAWSSKLSWLLNIMWNNICRNGNGVRKSYLISLVVNFWSGMRYLHILLELQFSGASKNYVVGKRGRHHLINWLKLTWKYWGKANCLWFDVIHCTHHVCSVFLLRTNTLNLIRRKYQIITNLAHSIKYLKE